MGHGPPLPVKQQKEEEEEEKTWEMKETDLESCQLLNPFHF